MTRIGLPVPPGFTLSTEACLRSLDRGALPDDVWDETLAAVHRLEALTGRRFGGSVGTPLLLSVRSGAKFSMPGMMDTVLNLGITETAIERLAAWSDDRHFASDAARRFVQTFGKVVLGVDEMAFQRILSELRERRGAPNDAALTADDFDEARRQFIEAITAAGAAIPDDPFEQLRAAVWAVFGSWHNRRAKEYRRLNGIPDDLGTACNVQTMVFGDLGNDSGTGVCFTRDPSTGERIPYGDYLENAQGEDVVAGIRNTLSLADLATIHPVHHAELTRVMATLERHYRDMCDIEFTIEREKLWILQTRVGKRTAAAAVRMAVEMVERRAHRPVYRECDASSPPHSSTCSIPASRSPSPQRRLPSASTPRREPPGDRPCSMRTAPPNLPPKVHPSSWCAGRRRPTTSTAWRHHRASSPATGAAPATPPSWRGAWVSQR